MEFKIILKKGDQDVQAFIRRAADMKAAGEIARDIIRDSGIDADGFAIQAPRRFVGRLVDDKGAHVDDVEAKAFDQAGALGIIARWADKAEVVFHKANVVFLEGE